MKEIWSDMKARGNMNIMLCSSVMCEEKKERKYRAHYAAKVGSVLISHCGDN